MSWLSSLLSNNKKQRGNEIDSTLFNYEQTHVVKLPNGPSVNDIRSSHANVGNVGNLGNAGHVVAVPARGLENVGDISHTLISGYNNKYVGKITSGTRAAGTGKFSCLQGSEEGNRYVGPFQNQTMVGRGTMYLPGGDVYEGERSKNGKKHGNGTYTWTNGNMYDGQWADGDRTGDGTFRWAGSGDIFVGEWVRNQRKGKGRYTWKDGTYYDGMWDNDKMHGQGMQKDEAGKLFHIEYKEGNVITKRPLESSLAEVVGAPHTLISGYGNEYVGKITSGTRTSGLGTFECLVGSEKGNRYDGPFLNQTMVGRGTMYVDGGDVYEGERSSNGKKHGKGTYTWKNGNMYEGDWADGQRFGTGTFRWTSGDMFVGQWDNSKRKGRGRYTWADGTWYDGMWDDDEKHGVGVQLMNGQLQHVEYNKNKLVANSPLFLKEADEN